MGVFSGQSLAVEFVTVDPDTGAAHDADRTPSAVLAKNGVDTAATCVVTKIDTGRYRVSVDLPVLALGDVVAVVAIATVAGMTSKAVVYQDSYDALGDFLRRWTHNKMVRTEDSETGIITYTLRNDDDTGDYCHWTYDPATKTRSAIVFD